ncbi:MAG: hypothetical protein H7A47_13705 [Verrucomicrobiales bacterium]|nr:hypothetical protein [Verrucomicrobiales bacterium]
MCIPTTWSLTAGQTIDAGTLSVVNDANNVYVTYRLTYDVNMDSVIDARFGALHVWVGTSLLNVPANPQGTPVPGQFCQALGGACADATGLTEYTFTIPFSAIGIVDVNTACGTMLYVVAHAEVQLDPEGDGTYEDTHETAFGGDVPVNVGSPGRWWFYGLYGICCDFGEPPVSTCQTAYAKGGWIWSTQRKSNPEGLPSLGLTQNRWGWAIQLTQPGITQYDIWAGAGLNNTANGNLVGTLTVIWDGSQVAVIYDLGGGAVLKEVHVYAGDAAPTTIAPGQCGYIDSWDPGVPGTVATLPLTAEDGVAWVVAHAVVCY